MSYLHISSATALKCSSSSGAQRTIEPPTADTVVKAIIVEGTENGKKFSNKDIAELLMAQEHLFIKPKTFNPIEGSDLFFEGATHIFAAEAKEGKTTETIEEVSKLKNKHIVMMDGDGNGIDAIDKKGDNTIWFQPVSPDAFLDAYITLIDSGRDFSNTVFIIDAMKNFVNGADIDSNRGSDKIMLRLKKLTNTGASLIILHHITKQENGINKLKGNSEGLYSSADITYVYKRNDAIVALKSRIAGIENGKVMRSYTALNHSSSQKDDL